MADGRHIENVGNAITRLPMDRFGRNLGGRIPLCPRHVRHDVVTMVRSHILHPWPNGGLEEIKCFFPVLDVSLNNGP